MAKRSYIPQLARLALRLSLYIQKHQVAMDPYLSQSQKDALTSCLPCLQTLAQLYARETP